MDWNWYNCPSCGAEWRGPLNWKQDDQNMGQHELDCPDRLAAQARLAALVVGDISYEAERAAVDDGHWATDNISVYKGLDGWITVRDEVTFDEIDCPIDEMEAAVRSLETTAGAADRLYQADLARRRAADDAAYEAERAAAEEARLHQADLDWLATAETELKRLRRNAARRARYAARKKE